MPSKKAQITGSKSMFAHALCNLSCLSQLELGCPYLLIHELELGSYKTVR